MKISKSLIQKIISENLKNHNIDPGCIGKGKINNFNVETGEKCDYTEEEKKQYYDYIDYAGCRDDNGVFLKINTETGEKCDNAWEPSMSSFQIPTIDFGGLPGDLNPGREIPTQGVSGAHVFTAKFEQIVQSIHDTLKLPANISFWNSSVEDIKAHVENQIQLKNYNPEELKDTLKLIKYIESGDAEMDELSSRYRKEYRDIKKKFKFVKAIVSAALQKITIKKSEKSEGVTFEEKEFANRVIKVAIARIFSTLEGGFLEKTTRLFSEKYFDQITAHTKNLEDIAQRDGISDNNILKRLFNIGISNQTDDWYIQVMWGKYRFIEEFVLKDERYANTASEKTMTSGGAVKRPATIEEFKNQIYNHFGVTEDDFKKYVKVFDITEIGEIMRMPSRQEFNEIKIKLIDKFKKDVSFNFNFDIESVDSADYNSSMRTAEEIIDGKTQIIKKSIIEPIAYGYFLGSDNSVTINVPFFYKIYEYEKSTDDEYYEYEKGGKKTLDLLIGTLIHEILHAIDHQLFLVLAMPNQILNKVLKKYINLRPDKNDKFNTYSASDLSTINLGETEIKNVKTAFNKDYLTYTVPKALKEFLENIKLAFSSDVSDTFTSLNKIVNYLLKYNISYLFWATDLPDKQLKSMCLYEVFKKYGLLKSHVDMVVWSIKLYTTPQMSNEEIIKIAAQNIYYGMNAMEIKVRSYSLIEYAKSKGYDLYDRSSFDKFAKEYTTDEIKKEVSDMSWFSRYLIELNGNLGSIIFPKNLQDVKDRAYNIFIYFAGKDVQLTETFLRHIIRKRILKVLLNERKSFKW